MGRVAFLAVFVASRFLPAQSAPFAVVSAASYQPIVAPDSLASMFGANLSQSTASASLDANGQLPTQLGGVTVQVDGQAASLIYVSPSQINFVVPGSAAPGTVSVTVQAMSTGPALNGTMQVQNTGAAIFTANASGSGPGSILNAVTYAGPPFLVVTPANNGGDERTRLAVFATGLRYAGNPSHDPSVTNVAGAVNAQGMDPNGNLYTFVVEYAGAAPGYFGLDQVNIVLPPQLDGAGTVSLTLTAETHASNVVTFQVGTLPVDVIGLDSLSLSQSAVIGGDTLTATISLNAPARSIGFPVSLRASSPAVQIPLSLTIPVGQVSAQFPVTTSPVTSVQMISITAQASSGTLIANLEVDPASTLQVTSFTVTPASVQGGTAASGTVTLSGPAPAGGVTAQVSSDNSAAQPPGAVSVPSGNNSVTFSIPTVAVSSTQTANLTATLGRSSQTAHLTVGPVLLLTLQSNSVVGGNSVTGTITLGSAAPVTGVTLNVQCDNRTIAQPPLTVMIPGGQTSVTFTVTTILVSVARTVTISVTYAGTTQSATLTVNPVGSASLAGLTISPGSVTGGANATGTVTLGAPAPLGGSSINLLSSNTFVAQVPAFVMVPEGATSATFTIMTTRVTAAQTVTITASAGGITKTATVTVQ